MKYHEGASFGWLLFCVLWKFYGSLGFSFDRNGAKVEARKVEALLIEKSPIYSFKNKDDETVFKDSFLSILKRCSDNQKTYKFGRWLSLVLIVLLEIKPVYSFFAMCYKEKSIGLGIFGGLIFAGIAWGISAIFNLVWMKMFSPVAFAWGGEQKHEDKKRHGHRNHGDRPAQHLPP